MLYTMAPLEAHSDDGFGAVGDAFQHAAVTLRNQNAEKSILLTHLPEMYLRRHAIELFLKSGIILVHRRLKLPYDAESYKSTKPKLLTSAGDWRPLFTTHDLPELYGYWKKLMRDHTAKLTEVSEHKPDMTVPAELDGWIATVGLIDPNSDYFRYPVSKNANADKEKSSFKEVPLEALIDKDFGKDEYIKMMLVQMPTGEVARAFKFDSSTIAAVAQAAREAADMMSNFHLMLRVELFGGW